MDNSLDEKKWELARLEFGSLPLEKQKELETEAKALTAYAFRNGPLEDIHASGGVSQKDIKTLMIAAVDKLYTLLACRELSPKLYKTFINDYASWYTSSWDKPTAKL